MLQDVIIMAGLRIVFFRRDVTNLKPVCIVESQCINIVCVHCEQDATCHGTPALPLYHLLRAEGGSKVAH